MPTYQLNINGEVKSVNADADTPILWILRDELILLGQSTDVESHNVALVLSM